MKDLLCFGMGLFQVSHSHDINCVFNVPLLLDEKGRCGNRQHLQDAREALALPRRRLSQVESPRDVGRAAVVLAACAELYPVNMSHSQFAEQICRGAGDRSQESFNNQRSHQETSPITQTKSVWA